MLVKKSGCRIAFKGFFDTLSGADHGNKKHTQNFRFHGLFLREFLCIFRRAYFWYAGPGCF